MNNIIEKTLEEKALEWWASITDRSKAQFPLVKSNDDIIAFYQDPSGFVMKPKYNY